MSDEVRFHPAAELFPMMSESELNELADDIRKNGLLEPIVRMDGLVIDGRNRLAACVKAGVTPRFTEIHSASPTQFVISKNILRRHLTLGQRAALAVEAATLLEGEARQRAAANLKQGNVADSAMLHTRGSKGLTGRSVEIAAKATGVGWTSVAHAKHVKRVDPEAFERIQRGEVTVNKAYERLRKSRPFDPDRIDTIRSLAEQGYRAEQIAKKVGLQTADALRVIIKGTGITINADKAVKGTRKLNADRIVQETVTSAEHLVYGLDLIELAQLDPSRFGEWIASLTDSIKALQRLLRQLKGTPHEG